MSVDQQHHGYPVPESAAPGLSLEETRRVYQAMQASPESSERIARLAVESTQPTLPAGFNILEQANSVAASEMDKDPFALARADLYQIHHLLTHAVGLRRRNGNPFVLDITPPSASGQPINPQEEVRLHADGLQVRLTHLIKTHQGNWSTTFINTEGLEEPETTIRVLGSNAHADFSLTSSEDLPLAAFVADVAARTRQALARHNQPGRTA